MSILFVNPIRICLKALEPPSPLPLSLSLLTTPSNSTFSSTSPCFLTLTLHLFLELYLPRNLGHRLLIGTAHSQTIKKSTHSHSLSYPYLTILQRRQAGVCELEMKGTTRKEKKERKRQGKEREGKTRSPPIWTC